MSSRYVHFTDEQKEQARRTDLCELLRSQGETLKRSGSEYEWKDGSQKVTIRGNLWFHQYDREGGDAIGFVRRFYNKNYPEAVEYLLGGCSGTLSVSPPIERKPSKPFELPPRNDNMRRVYAYLLSRRGLDRDVVNAFAHRQMIYESAKYHNAVFVGFDQNGVPRHANMRGTGSESTFKGNADSSIPEFSFHWTGKSKYLCLFEAPIDMLSFISIHKKNWQQHSYAAACSLSDRVLFQMLEDNPNISDVFLCLDSDEYGQAAAKRISENTKESLMDFHKRPSEYNIETFCNQVFMMYDGEPCAVQLRCQNDMMKTIIDRFGDDVDIHEMDDKSFTIAVEVLKLESNPVILLSCGNRTPRRKAISLLPWWIMKQHSNAFT